jgi:hypothetical protein
VQRIRLQFEMNRQEGVYFPLNRDGDFWVSFADKDGAQGFKMFETAAEAAAAEKKLRASGFRIEAQGRRDGNYRAKNAPSGTFVADVIGILKKADAPEKVQDDVYQTFLRSLPEMSMRKHSIHRKKVPGFSEDILRTFSKNAFHGAHQLARLRHAHELQAILDAAQMSMDNYRRSEDVLGGQSSDSGALDVARGDALLGELKKRHDYIMSPKDTQLANVANSIGFLYHLGASPASALTNLTQNAQVTLPVLGAHHGWLKASRMLGAPCAMPCAPAATSTARSTTRKSARRTTCCARAAISTRPRRTRSPPWPKATSLQIEPGCMREAAGGAGLHVPQSRGDQPRSRRHGRVPSGPQQWQGSFEDAVQYASDIINGTHFDYSACVDDDTEILTSEGWKGRSGLRVGDTAIAVNTAGAAVSSKVLAVNVYAGPRQVTKFMSSRKFAMVTTPNHDCVVQTYSNRDKKWRRLKKVRADELANHHFIVRAPLSALDRPEDRYGSDFAALLGWIAAEGWYAKYRNCKNKNDVRIAQSLAHNPAYVAEIRGLLDRLGGEYKEYFSEKRQMVFFVLRRALGRRIQECLPAKILTAQLVAELSTNEMRALIDAFCKADGSVRDGAWTICQNGALNIDELQAMATMCGMRATRGAIKKNGMASVRIKPLDAGYRSHVRPLARTNTTVEGVWCPDDRARHMDSAPQRRCVRDRQ